MVEVDGEVISKFLEVPCVIFTRVVSREISTCNIGDGLGVDAYYLCLLLAPCAVAESH
jgi:hypothetical protein